MLLVVTSKQRMNILFHVGMPYKQRFQHRKKQEREKRQKRLKTSTSSLESESSITITITDELSITTTDETFHETLTECGGDLLSTNKLTDDQNTRDVPLRHLHESLTLPSKAWCDQSPEGLKKLILCKLSQGSGSSAQPMMVTHSLTVNSDFTWKLFVLNHEITRSCNALGSFPSKLDQETFSQLLTRLDNISICIGQPDTHFVRMVAAKKGKVLSNDGKIMCAVDSNAYMKTVRTSDCEILATSEKCSACKNYRATLRSMYHRWSRKSQSSSDSCSTFANERYLNTPQKKKKMEGLKKRARIAEQTVLTLQEKIRRLTENSGEMLDENLHSDMIAIMKENSEKVKSAYPEGSFARLFWEEQMKAACLNNTKQVRWHPVLIKWCLNLKLLSSSAYHALRSSGFLKLPSERTLRDYTHYFVNKTGFMDEVDEQLLSEIPASLPASRRSVVLLIDEMKVREGLVYNKYSGEIIGFTKLGDINDDLLRLENENEQEVAKQILVLMVRGIMFRLVFPYAHFGTRGVTADLLFPIVWEAIRRLEARGLKVLCITADGASSNRKFFRMHHAKKDPGTYFYKARNPYSSDNRWVYFVSDPPHLIKTVRNCWSHSGVDGTRHMKV